MEIGDQVVEVGGPVVIQQPEPEPVLAEPDQDVDQEEELEESAEIVDEPEETEELDFVCPDSGFFPSPYNCAQYYQCTEEKTVIIINDIKYFDNELIICSRLSLNVLTDCTMTPVSRPVTGLTRLSVRLSPSPTLSKPPVPSLGLALPLRRRSSATSPTGRG